MRKAARVPRDKRCKPDPDVSRFQPLVAEALKAFGSNYHYAEQMMKNCSTIERKRAQGPTRARYKELSGGGYRPPKGWSFRDAVAIMEEFES